MSDKDEARREVTLEELAAAKERGDNAFLSTVKAKGVCTIFDKDGNVKSTFNVETIDHGD